MGQLVNIELFGQSYTFKAESESIKAKEVADFLVREVAKVETQHSGESSHMTKLTILIITALNIAKENYELKTNYFSLLRDISEQSKSLICVLDAGLQ